MTGVCNPGTLDIGGVLANIRCGPDSVKLPDKADQREWYYATSTDISSADCAAPAGSASHTTTAGCT